MLELALLIARQRSGTGALGTVLDQHRSLKYSGEVFHPANLGEATNFFAFKRNLQRSDPDIILPDANERVFEAFLTHLRGLAPGRLPILDVKYRSLHHMNGGWQGVVDPPWILRYARARQAPIIHLTRANLVETYVSGLLADANKIWHATSADEVKARSVSVEGRALLHYLDVTTREVELVNQWLRGAPAVVEIDYRELMGADGLLREAVGEKICATLGVEAPTIRSPVFVKQAPAALSASISNFEHVREMLRGTRYEWMIQPR